MVIDMALSGDTLLRPWKPKITRIHDMWIQPCGISPLAWFAGYFAATPVLFGSLLQPDCIDATADRVRKGHRRRRRGSINIADYAKPIAAPTGGAGWAVFSLGSFAQRIGWYLGIADATLDWIIHGTSLAYQWSGCADPSQGYAYLEMDNDVPLLLPATTSVIYSWKVKDKHIFGAGPTGIATPKGHQPGVGFSITQKPGHFFPLPDCSFSCRIYDRAERAYLTGPLIPAPDPDGNLSIAWVDRTPRDIFKTHNFEVHCTKTFGVMYVSGHFTASGTNLEGMGFAGCTKQTPGL